MSNMPASEEEKKAGAGSKGQTKTAGKVKDGKAKWSDKAGDTQQEEVYEVAAEDISVIDDESDEEVMLENIEDEDDNLIDNTDNFSLLDDDIDDFDS